MLAEIHPRLPTLIERTAAWAGRRRSGLAVFVCAAAAVAAVAAGLVRFESDAPLFDAALRPSQSADVENALTLWGEPFHADAQGTQIYVAASRRRDLLLRLTLAGLPRRYVPTSADVLDDQANALTPQSVLDDRRRSGIEGDLVSGLRRIAGVADAVVVLPSARNDPLDDPGTSAPVAAAVQLTVEPGATLSADSVAGIKRFVASAWPGLSPERVTVVDGSGAAIGSFPSPDASTAKERRIETSVQSALDAVFGAGAAVVRVDVEAAGSEQQVRSTKVVPHGPLSADVARERGTDAGKSFDRERTVRRFAYDTVAEQRSTQADAPERTSVAVFLDSARVSQDAASGIAALVRAAAGADLAGGDAVVVRTMAFATPRPVPSAAPGAAPDVRAAAIRAAVAFAIALFGLATLPLARTATLSAPSAAHVVPAAVQEAEGACYQRASSVLVSLEGESPHAAAYVLASMPSEIREAVLRRCSPSRRARIAAHLDVPS